MKQKQGPVIIIGIVTLATLFLTHFFLTSGKCSHCGYLTLSATMGQFGDFYGGVLGTLVALFSVYFIYATYQTQNEQLKNAKKDADFQILNTLYADLIQEISSIQYRRQTKTVSGEIIIDKVFNGLDALYNFDPTHKDNPNSVLNHLNSILVSFDHLINMVNKVLYKYGDMKETMRTKAYFLYYSKIIWPVYERIYRDQKEYLLQTKHPDATLLFSTYERQVKETYKYLLDMKLVGEPSEEKIKVLIKPNK